MTNNITRDSIAEFIHQEFGLTKIDCNHFVNDLIEEIIVSPLISEDALKLILDYDDELKNLKSLVNESI